METPNDLGQFNPQPPTLPPLSFIFRVKAETPFQEAIFKVGEMEFMDVYRAKNWMEIMPCPDEPFPITEIELISRRYLRLPAISKNEQRLKWTVDASVFFDRCQKELEWQHGRLKHYFEQGLELWKLRGRQVNLSSDELVAKWCGRNSEMLFKDFCGLYITPKTTTPFFEEINQKQEIYYGLGNQADLSKLESGLVATPSSHEQHSFDNLLKNGFTSTDLDALLVHMLIKNQKGEKLKFKKYILHSIINALALSEFFEKSNQERDQKSLSIYLGLKPTRIKATEGKDLYKAQSRAQRYLDKLKKERKKNSSK